MLSALPLVEAGRPPADPPGPGYQQEAGILPAAGITVSQTGGLVTDESGGSVTFSVVLNAAPQSDVVVSIDSSDATEGVVDKSQLTFTADNWDVPQVVTVTGVDDEVRDRHVAYTVRVAVSDSGDQRYAGLENREIQVTNEDNDRSRTRRGWLREGSAASSTESEHREASTTTRDAVFAELGRDSSESDGGDSHGSAAAGF